MKRFISLLLTAMIIFTSVPTAVFAAVAEPEQCTITVETVNGTPGMTVNVSVIVENNPGILGMTMKLEYDDSALTLVDAKSGEAFSVLEMTPPKNYKNGCNFLWYKDDIAGSDIVDGSVLYLTFAISEEAEFGDEYEVKVSCPNGSVFDADLETVEVVTVAGVVSLMYLPGDVNGDENIAANDLIELKRYLVDGGNNNIDGYNVDINEYAADVNQSNSVAPNDLILIARYISDGCTTDPEGYNVTLLPSLIGFHKHTIEHVEAVDATCTEDGNEEYWYCDGCKKYFSDENGKNKISEEDTVVEKLGHTLLHIDTKPASPDEEGYIEHWKCEICLKYFLDSIGTDEISEEDIIIPPLVKNMSTVTYNVYGSDTYLESIGVNNPNETSFYSDEGLVLNDIVAPEGYIFKGWTTASGTPITEIEPGNPRHIVLNAVWDKTQYTISFYSPIAPRASVKRTIDESVPIDDLNELTKYKFMGWTDVYGNKVTMVKPGTKDITLFANWISYRNQTISNDYLSKGPIIIEDEEKGQYLFIYDIGKIINVPLYTIKDFGNTTSGIIRVESETVTNSISSTTAKEITETIAKSTTNSATWTLSKDWNDLITNTEDFTESQLKEDSIIISDGWAHTDSSGKNTGTVTDTGTLSRDNTNTKDLTTHNAGGSVEVDVGIAKEGLAKKLSPVSVDIGIEGHYDYTHQGGTETENGTDTYNLIHTNDLKSTSKSETNSRDETTSNKIAEEVSKNWGYSISKSSGGENSASENSSNTQSNESAYSTTFSYTTAQEKTTVKEFSTASAEPGWHRLVCAGTVRVFAVVGYDIATHTYFYYTYSVLDDATSEFYDYSATNGEYNDYEVGVLPFECPIDVHHYVTNKVYMTNGIVIDDTTGMVVDYEGNYTHINIPDYYSRDNNDGTYDVVKIVGIEPSVFAGDKTIESIRLSDYITEIPAGAFSECSSLKTIEYNSIESIGNNAFYGCTSLENFKVEKDVTVLGNNAFSNVPSVTVDASNVDVAQAASSCGAISIVLNFPTDTNNMKNVVLTTSDSTQELTVNGYKKSYKNIEIASNADTTNINGINFINNEGVPMTLTSSEVSLTNVNVIDANNFAIILKEDQTNVIVNGTNSLSTVSDNTFLSKSVSVTKLSGSNVKCVLQISNGKIYICGNQLTASDMKYIEADTTQIEYINAEEFDNMLNSHYVYFNANGGSVSQTEKTVTYGGTYGTLPTPTRDYYEFLGWYTAASGGTKVTASTKFTGTSNVTLYAQWKQKAVSSDWVLESQMPAGAQIVETKYKYDLTKYTTSSSSSLSGWTKYDTKWVWSAYGSWSAWQTGAVTETDSRDVETQQVVDVPAHTEYRYGTFLNSKGERKPCTYLSSQSTVTDYSDWSDTQTAPYKAVGTNYKCYRGASDHVEETNYHKGGQWLDKCIQNGSDRGEGYYWPAYMVNGEEFFWEETRSVAATYKTQYRYRDRSKVYTYYYKMIEKLESTTYPTGDNISNIQKYVKYREK